MFMSGLHSCFLYLVKSDGHVHIKRKVNIHYAFSIWFVFISWLQFLAASYHTVGIFVLTSKWLFFPCKYIIIGLAYTDFLSKA